VGNLIPHVAQLGQTKGQDGTQAQYGIPFTTSTRALFYNTALFQQAGIAAPPQTWADVAADAAKIKALGKTGFGLPLGSEEAQAETYLWFLGNGGGYKDASGKWAINSPQNVATFQWLTDNLVKPGLTEADPATKARTDLWKDFAAGNTGMINGSPSLLPILKEGSIGSNWKAAAIPGKTGPVTSPLGVADFIEAFNTHSDHKTAIGEFLDFALQKQVPGAVRQRVRPAAGDPGRGDRPVDAEPGPQAVHRRAALGRLVPELGPELGPGLAEGQGHRRQGRDLRPEGRPGPDPGRRDGQQLRRHGTALRVGGSRPLPTMSLTLLRGRVPVRVRARVPGGRGPARR